MIEQLMRLAERVADIYAEKVSVEKEFLRVRASELECRQKSLALEVERHQTMIDLDRAATENHRAAAVDARAARELNAAKEAYGKLVDRVNVLEALWIRQGLPTSGEESGPK